MVEKRSEGYYHYRIEIQGQLSESRARAFDELEVTLTGDGHTIISGKKMDQSALFGVLLLIRDLGAPLLSVTRCNPGPNASTKKVSRE